MMKSGSGGRYILVATVKALGLEPVEATNLFTDFN